MKHGLPSRARHPAWSSSQVLEAFFAAVFRVAWRSDRDNETQEGPMQQRTTMVWTWALALLWLTGCQTLGDVMQEKTQGGGTTQVYPVDTDQAWKIALTVLRWEGSDAIEEHRD